MSLRKLTFASGGGIWRKIGYALGKELVDLGCHLDVYATGNPMSMSNPQLVSEGKADLGITRHCVVDWAMKGMKPYEKKMPNLRAVITLPRTDWINFIVGSSFGVSTYGELVEKRPPLKIMGFGREHIVGYIVSQILQEYGADLEDVEKWGGKAYLKGFAGIEGGPTELAGSVSPIDAIKKGLIDAYYGPAPRTPVWVKMSMAKPVSFISLEEKVIGRLNQKYGHQHRIVHPSTYPNQERGFTTIEFPGYLIFTRKDLDDELIKNITKAMVENITKFAESGDGLEAQPGIGVARNWGVPLHPGAKEYYESKGWLPS